jgi:uncharacterized protein (DUF1800 family)
MRLVHRWGEIVASSLRVLVTGVLCVVMVEQPIMAAPLTRKTSRASKRQIQAQERALHVLNRFTFGARPEDIAVVESIGVRRWFEQQLNPSHIDDSSVDTRLAMFPAMQMQQAELMERYPGPQVLRQMIAKNLPLPSDPVEHAIYADQIAFYEAAKAKREEKQAVVAAPANEDGGQSQGSTAQPKSNAALSADNVAPATPAMAVHEEQLDAVKIIHLPRSERMQRILAMSPETFIAFRKSLTGGELATMADGLTPVQRETVAALQGSPRMLDAELMESRMLRDIYSERQLQAVMTDFWLNHFNVYSKKNQDEPYLLPAYERDVIRPRALGKFEDLLVAVAQSPAMLMYLDNWQSIGPDSLAAQNAQGRKAPNSRGLNENYARELMELHTIGVQCEVSQDHPVKTLSKACGKGYTQQDVTQVAKVLTGWTIDQPNRVGAYRFEERRHEPGTKIVMGKTIAENGEAEGLQLLHMLATSPATARFISTQLTVRFVSDTPPPKLVDRMTKAFLSSDGDIKTVMRTMFNSPEFWSPEVYRAKVKTPEEFVVSAVRASGAEVTNASALVQSLNKLGMPFYGMQTPNGYSWMAENWVNTGDLVSRMNFALNLSSNRIPGVITDWTGVLGQGKPGVEPAAFAAGSVEALRVAKEHTLETVLLGQAASEQTRSTVLAQGDSQQLQQQAFRNFAIRPKDAEPTAHVLRASSPRQQVKPPLDWEAAAMGGLLLGSPEFQRR